VEVALLIIPLQHVPPRVLGAHLQVEGDADERLLLRRPLARQREHPWVCDGRGRGREEVAARTEVVVRGGWHGYARAAEGGWEKSGILLWHGPTVAWYDIPPRGPRCACSCRAGPRQLP